MRMFSVPVTVILGSVARAAKARGAGFDITVIDRNFRAQFVERLNVQVDRASADGATARKGNPGVTKARD